MSIDPAAKYVVFRNASGDYLATSITDHDVQYLPETLNDEPISEYVFCTRGDIEGKGLIGSDITIVDGDLIFAEGAPALLSKQEADQAVLDTIAAAYTHLSGLDAETVFDDNTTKAYLKSICTILKISTSP